MTVGKTIEREIVVDNGRAVTFLGDGLRVYGTPSMIADIEMVCRDLAFSDLAQREDTVGSHLLVDHLGPALIDDVVKISAEIKERAGRVIAFEAKVYRAGSLIGTAFHRRAVVDLDRLKAKLIALRG